MANEDNTLLWILGGTAVGIGLYFLFRPKGIAAAPGPGVTQAAEMPPSELQTTFATLDEVAQGLDNAKTRYRSGQDTHTEALGKVSQLQIGIDRLWNQVDQARAMELRRQIQIFNDQILEAQAMESVPA